jgi:hypothetical protein
MLNLKTLETAQSGETLFLCSWALCLSGDAIFLRLFMNNRPQNSVMCFVSGNTGLTAYVALKNGAGIGRMFMVYDGE